MKTAPEYHDPYVASSIEDSRVKQLQSINADYHPTHNNYQQFQQPQYQQQQPGAYTERRPPSNRGRNGPPSERSLPKPPSESYSQYEPEPQQQRYENARYEQSNSVPSEKEGLSPSNRFKSNPVYYNTYDSELQRRREEQMRMAAIDEMARSKLNDRKGFRQNNPTNLSLNLAAQSIVGNP